VLCQQLQNLGYIKQHDAKNINKNILIIYLSSDDLVLVKTRKAFCDFLVSAMWLGGSIVSECHLPIAYITFMSNGTTFINFLSSIKFLLTQEHSKFTYTSEYKRLWEE
jgi:hypothetical protein